MIFQALLALVVLHISNRVSNDKVQHLICKELKRIRRRQMN